MWPFKNKQVEEIKQYLIPVIQEVALAHAIKGINEVLESWDSKRMRLLKEESIQSIKTETAKYVQSEEFLDKIVARIKNKQLGVN